MHNQVFKNQYLYMNMCIFLKLKLILSKVHVSLKFLDYFLKKNMLPSIYNKNPQRNEGKNITFW